MIDTPRMSKAASLPIGGKRNEAILFEGCKLERENEALRKDAERYRWLRDKVDADAYYEIGIILDTCKPDEIDAAIDAVKLAEHLDNQQMIVDMLNEERMMQEVEAKLKEKNNG